MVHADFPVFPRGYLHPPLKNLIKKFYVFIADSAGDLHHPQITVFQQFAAFFDADILDIFAQRHPGFLLKPPADIGNAVMLLLTECSQRQAVLIVPVYIFQHFLHRRTVGALVFRFDQPAQRQKQDFQKLEPKQRITSDFLLLIFQKHFLHQLPYLSIPVVKHSGKLRLPK